MSKATISRNIDRVAVISSPGQATAPATQVRDQNFPSGDQAVRSLVIRYDATMSGTSTPTLVTNGHIFYLNAITVETDKHGKLVDAVDGLLLHVVNKYDFGTAPQATALSATPADSDTPSASWIIPFSSFHGIRPYDTNIDMQKARMKVSTQYGAVTNLWTQSGGTPLVVTNTQSIETKILPGPLIEKDNPATGQSSELPTYIRTLEQMVVPITSTTNRFQIAIPFGDRIYKRLFITQRNLSTKIELATVVVATAEVSLYLNNIPIVDRRRFCDIQADNKLEYGIETLSTGVAVLDFDMDFQERLFDMLWALTTDAGNMYLFIDVTSVSNGSLLLGLDCLKPIPAAALRG